MTAFRGVIAAERVARGVVRSVGLHLDDARRRARPVRERADEDLTQKVGRDLGGRTREERARQIVPVLTDALRRGTAGACGAATR